MDKYIEKYIENTDSCACTEFRFALIICSDNMVAALSTFLGFSEQNFLVKIVHCISLVFLSSSKEVGKSGFELLLAQS